MASYWYAESDVVHMDCYLVPVCRWILFAFVCHTYHLTRNSDFVCACVHKTDDMFCDFYFHLIYFAMVD